MEQWKDIKDFEEFYQISTYGRIKSKDRYIKTCGNGVRFAKSKIIKPVICTNGYHEIHLRVNGKRTVKMLHRVVAEAFIENQDNLPEVNHKDENPANNHVENLEWCTSKYNANYGTRNQRMVKDKYLKPVIMMDKDGSEIKRFKSMGEATRETGADISAIIRTCKGKQNTCVGYKWKYA